MSFRTFDFQTQVNEARNIDAELAVADRLFQIPYVKLVVDKRERRESGDFILELVDGSLKVVEVKRDSHIDESKRICVEYAHRMPGKPDAPGWIYGMPEPDILAVVGSKLGTIRLFDFVGIKGLYLEGGWKPVAAHNDPTQYRPGYDSWNRLIPMFYAFCRGLYILKYDPDTRLWNEPEEGNL